MANDVSIQLKEIQENVKVKIKSQFGDLFPDEFFDQMVKSVQDEFIQKDLRDMIREELELFYRAKVSDFIKSPEMSPIWGSHGYEPSEAFKAVMVECAPAMFASVASRMAADTVMSMQNSGLLPNRY